MADIFQSIAIITLMAWTTIHSYKLHTYGPCTRKAKSPLEDTTYLCACGHHAVMHKFLPAQKGEYGRAIKAMYPSGTVLGSCSADLESGIYASCKCQTFLGTVPLEFIGEGISGV